MTDLTCRSENNRWFMGVLFAGMLLFAFYASTHMVAAGDTWVAMACGRHFDTHGVDTVEPFSFNSHHAGPTDEDIAKWPGWAKTLCKPFSLETIQKWHPTGWVNQNWLTHVIFYWLTHESPFADAESRSFNSLVYWKFAIYIICVACVYYIARIHGADPAISAAFACFAMFIGRSFLDIRPAGFSNVLVAIFILVLALATYKNALYVWLIVPIAVFWCNVHGGYIYVFIMLVPFIVLHFLTILPKKWTISIHCILSWGVLYALTVKSARGLKDMADEIFRGSKFFETTPISEDWFPKLFLVLVIAGIILTALKKIDIKGVCAYNIIASLIVFFSLLARVFPTMPTTIERYPELVKEFSKNIHSSQLTFFLAVIVGLVGLAIILTFFKHILITLKPRHIKHSIAAGIAAFIAVIVFNPFHLTNLTHTIVISVSKHAKMWRSVNEWHPAFEWTNPVGDEIPFLIMYILAWLLIVLWAVVLIYAAYKLQPGPDSRGDKKKNKNNNNETAGSYRLPKIDLPLMIIAAMTIYMAIRSRRFIPVAANVACPILALLLHQVIQALAAIRNFRISGLFSAPPMPSFIRSTIICTGAFTVAFFAVWWGQKFKRIYLDAWPSDTKLTSVFMRMTASDSKPFYAGEFIRKNRMEGKMFNYWTEGGFIAWAQDPDPNTGKTPLQLFMDGRAQAAYEPEAYRLWSNIMSGGHIVRDVKNEGRKLTQDDLTGIGKWIAEQLDKHDVWVVLMPAAQAEKPFAKGLERHADWQLVFFNNKQRLYINRKRAPQLLKGKETVYPNHFTRNIFLARNFINFSNDPKQKQQGLNLAFKAFGENPSQLPMREILLAARFPELTHQVNQFVLQYLQDFVENKDTWVKQHGYHHKITAALVAANYLGKLAERQKDQNRLKFYTEKIREYEQERLRVINSKRW